MGRFPKIFIFRIHQVMTRFDVGPPPSRAKAWVRRNAKSRMSFLFQLDVDTQ
uniref:Uncharacterized protein n=1 Tax=Candidatus Kentrum sp. SD TaxID=2126332 RepID=A0A450YGF0_9GAMM|nr:MAG: hypothetical protein BECKSD772F_GA0070984_10644 [Candidatus Kentron sp. SD]VFK45923.1 MAG: hypothetical protein BECKSD772E_GA0070983_10644 [Candidatus Kentron sp. SD]VFK79855.1 MAG: hypothetical protein BECKSD772D_GA0070982_10705 [Candidatus Kentron sp. SD]